MKSPLRLAAAAALCLAAAPATRPSALRLAVRDLASPDPVRAAAAAVAVETIDPDRAPLLSAEAESTDVPAAARVRLRDLLARQRSRFAGLAVERHRSLAVGRWRERADLDAYERGAHRDRRWDAAATGGIVGFHRAAVAWTTADTRKRLYAVAAALLARAVAAGCDDPVVLAVRGLADDAAGAPAATVAADMARALAAGPGDPRLTLAAEGRLVVASRRIAASRPTTGPSADDDARRRVDDMVVQLGRVAATPGVPQEVVYQCGVAVWSAVRAAGMDEPAAFADVRRAVDASLPGGAASLELRGDHEFARARSTSDADSRAAACDRPDVAAHLSAAMDAYAAAWKLDGTNHHLAVNALRVLTLRRADRPTFDLWFRRAVATAPDDVEAYDRKRAYLSPRFGGSTVDQLAFAHDCLASENVVAGVPMVAVRVYEQLAPHDSAGAAAYWTRPDVWQDVSAAFEVTLALYPTADSTRSSYAAWACHCGQWERAVLLFDQLGDKVDPTAFNGPERLVEQRGRAVAEARRFLAHAPT